MAISKKIEHVDQLANGVLRFRRRWPKDVKEHFGEPAMQVHIRNTSGLSFYKEYDTLLEHFEKRVSQARSAMQQNGTDTRTSRDKWHDALLAASGLRKDVIGVDPDDQETGELIEKSLPDNTDPTLVKALEYPSAPSPKHTLADALNLYRQDKQVTDGSKKDIELKRVTKRLKEALGDPDKLPLEEMTVAHRRRYLEFMLNAKKDDGKTLALGSAKRETNTVVAIVNHAIKEMDIVAKNQFADLPWPSQETSKLDVKLPLPDEIVASVKTRLEGVRDKNPDLMLIWSLLVATGARLGEVVGLKKDDIVLDSDIPHILFRPNSVRRLKNKSSVRSIPLTDNALKALTSALEGIPKDSPLFERYSGPRGSDAASAALMKHLRQETKDKQLSVHGLRHRASDKLREAGSPPDVRKGFLGHAAEGISEDTYGGREARLKEFAKWASKSGL